MSCSFAANGAMTAISLTLPIAVSAWNGYTVECQIMNNTGSNVPGFNNCAVIPSDFTASGFVLRGWNSYSGAVSYRCAVRVSAI